MFDLTKKQDLVWRYDGFGKGEPRKWREEWHLIFNKETIVAKSVRMNQRYLDMLERPGTPDDNIIFVIPTRVDQSFRLLFPISQKYKASIEKLWKKSAAEITTVDFYDTCPIGETGE